MTSVSVIYHYEPEGWWADSPDIPGWTATADSVDALRSLAEEGVRFALESDEVVVEHQLGGMVLQSAVIYDFVLGQTTAVGQFAQDALLVST
jgi:predicted RNase H-like HicB family nuclease